MKKMREINYIFYMVLMYSFSCLYGIFYKNKIADILKFQSINLGYLGIFIILVISYLFLFIKHNKTMEDVIKFITKILIGMTLILMGINFPKQWLMGLIVYTIIMLIILFIPQKKVKESSKLELYPSRKNLMDVLSHALGEYSLISLDGTWGSGKTTFMNIAMRENKEKYYYIPINVMLFENRNSLKTEFLNQLKGIFKEEGIFQGSLMDFDYYLDGVSNDWVKVVKNIIFSKSKSFKEANEKLKSEIGKIEKRIVVGVDNLERIYGESEQEWKQILGFIHELQELGIKIVVMADLEKMLVTKKKTGEKDLSNHEYFDKFYEFKLKLNEVTTEEIIDGIENKTLDKECLKEQILELTDDLEKYTEMFYDMNQGLSKTAPEGTTEENYFSIKYPGIDIETVKEEKLELFKRYHINIKNPRKIEKLIKGIQIKEERIGNIFNFIDEDEYKKLIFRAFLFSLVYFDYMKEMQEKGFSELHGKNSFFRYFFLRLGDSSRGINRLLFYDSKENLIIEEIKKLISAEKINLSTIDKSLKDLEVYSSSLDPDYNQKTTKKAYKIIESKLIELEKAEKEQTHKIIKDNESFICKMNYLCHPDKVGIYGEVDYKFNEKNIFEQYQNIFKILDRVIYKLVHNNYKAQNREIKSFKNFRTLILLYFKASNDNNMTYNSKIEFKMKKDEEFHKKLRKSIKMEKILTNYMIEQTPQIYIDELSDMILKRKKYLFFNKELEDKIFEQIENILKIMEIEFRLDFAPLLNKKVVIEEWKELDIEKKLKLLKNIKSKEEWNEKLGRELIKIIPEEKDVNLMIELFEIMVENNNQLFNKTIKEYLLKIGMGDNHLKSELVRFLNKEFEEKKYIYINDEPPEEFEQELRIKGIIRQGGKFVFIENEDKS